MWCDYPHEMSQSKERSKIRHWPVVRELPAQPLGLWDAPDCGTCQTASQTTVGSLEFHGPQGRTWILSDMPFSF